MSTPKITALRVVPVAGRDSMLMNLSGAHGPFFTRNLVILTDSSGATAQCGPHRTQPSQFARWQMKSRQVV